MRRRHSKSPIEAALVQIEAGRTLMDVTADLQRARFITALSRANFSQRKTALILGISIPNLKKNIVELKIDISFLKSAMIKFKMETQTEIDSIPFRAIIIENRRLLERELCKEALYRANYNITHAGRILNLHYRTLRTYMKRYNITKKEVFTPHTRPLIKMAWGPERDEFQKQIILKALEKFDFHTRSASEFLGMPHKTLTKKRKKFGFPGECSVKPWEFYHKTN